MNPAINSEWAECAIAMAILAPLVGAIGIQLTGRWPNVRETVTMISAFTAFYFVQSLLPMVYGTPVTTLMPASGAGPLEYIAIKNVLPNVDLAFQVEPLGMLYALVAAGLWIPTSLYAVGYMRGHDEDNQTRFFTCFALAIFAALGIAFSKNLFTLFLFYEILTFSTYPLVTHYGDEEAKRAGRIYLGILVTTSVAFLLFAILLTLNFANTLDFKPGGILNGKIDGMTVPILLGLFAFGTGKAALMPFHKWLPNAMVAPTPVSALLHAVAIVKAGVFTVLKVIVYIFGIDFLTKTNASEWLMWVAAFTLMSSSIIALTKDNLKARLAYSTISQLAYITLGAAIATKAAIAGAAMHIAMHAVGKITLFFCAGAIYVALHKKYISQMNGIGRKMPFTMSAFFLGSICIIGLPPMGGSWSKWYICLGALDAGHMVFVFILMISSLLSIGYLMPVVVRAFFFEPDPDDDHGHDGHGQPTSGHAEKKAGFWANIQEAPVLCVGPLCLTAVGCIALFFFAPAIYDLVKTITGVN
jgi:multicomponent Na+:H+ antiporter subunit D